MNKFFILLFVFSLGLNNAIAAGDVKKGQRVSKKCIACHDFSEKKKNKVGPALKGIVGQPAGKVPGYKYSKKHLKKASEIIWDEATLNTYLTNPRAFFPGNKMAFPGLKKETDRENIIEYLKSLK